MSQRVLPNIDKSLPPAVATASPHSLVMVPEEHCIELFVKETEFTAAEYPRRCTVDLLLPVWDDGEVIMVALLLRLADRNRCTFEAWINVAEPRGVRLIQLLAQQQRVNVHIATERIFRSFRCSNTAQAVASKLVDLLRHRQTWTPDAFDQRLRQFTTLYPSAHTLWYECLNR